MKYTLYILLTAFSILFIACEDVVEVDVDSIEPRLVVEANIEWERGQDASTQQIILSESTDFFNQSQVPVTTATVSVTKVDSNERIDFLPIGEGVYETNDFVAELGADYRLDIVYAGEEYQAFEKMMSVTPVSRVEQSTVVGFDGDDVESIDFFTEDQAGVENFYYVTYDLGADGNPYLSIWDDAFRDGNEIEFIFREAFLPTEETIDVGDSILIEYMGASKQFYEFMFLLTEQAYGGGDPFASTPVQLKGNVANLTNTDKDAFGYFRLSEKDTFTVVVE